MAGLEEARAYLAHPVLGPRLHECADALLSLGAGPGGRLEAADVLGSIDAAKLRSSMTLFSRAADDDDRFRRVLEEYFQGEPDQATLDRL